MSMFEHFGTLLCTQPVAGAEPELLDSFHSADPRSQLGTQQARVGGFVSQAANSCKLLVNGVGRQLPRFQVHSIAHDDDTVEGQSGFRTEPGNELVDGVLVYPARGRGAEAVEHSQFAMIQIWKAKDSATVVRLDSVLAHDDGLPMPQE